MGSKLGRLLGVALAGLILAACGGSGSHATGSDSAFVSTLSTSSSTLVQGDSNLAAPDQRTYLVSTTGWGGRAASGRTATVWLFLNPSGHGACWAIRGAHGFAHPLAVRIHRTADALGRSFVSLTSGSGFKSSGCTFVPASKLKAIEANPSAFYVAVRSADFPNGAVRGNL